MLKGVRIRNTFIVSPKLILLVLVSVNIDVTEWA